MNLLTNLWAIPFPNIDPVALQIGPVAIKWYGLAYLAGLLLGWLYIRRLLSEPQLWAGDRPPFEAAKVDDLLLYITAGVVLGGRLGFVIFYEPSYYLANPQDIIAVWKGGMAFHGALVGCIIAIWAVRSPQWRQSVEHGRPGHCGGADRPVLRPHRQLHQRRAVRPPDDAAVGHGVSRGRLAPSGCRADAAPPEPAL